MTKEILNQRSMGTNDTPATQPAGHGIIPFEFLLFTKAELARYLDVEVRTVEHWMSRRLIPYIKIGGTVRFKAYDVMRHLEAHHQVHPRIRGLNSHPMPVQPASGQPGPGRTGRDL